MCNMVPETFVDPPICSPDVVAASHGLIVECSPDEQDLSTLTACFCTISVQSAQNDDTGAKQLDVCKY